MIDYIIQEMFIDIGCTKIPAGIWTIDRNHLFRSANLHALRAIGVGTYEELIGKTIFDFSYIPSWSLKIAQNKYHIDEMIMQSGVIDRHTQHMQLSSEFPFTMQLEWLKKPLFNSDGNVIGLHATEWILYQERNIE